MTDAPEAWPLRRAAPGVDSAILAAERELIRARVQVDETRALLARLQPAGVRPASPPTGPATDQLVEANEQLIEGILQAHAHAETVARDIAFQEQVTRLRMETQRLNAENRQIHDAGRLKRQFISSMSHEMRTPLNAVIGFAELLKTGSIPVLSPKYLQFLGHITDSGQQLLRMIDDVLDLSRIEAGKLEFHAVAVDLAEVMEELIEFHRPAASRTSVVVRFESEPGLGELVLDRTRLKQAISNYLSNAIKFSLPGGWVTLRARPEGTECFRVEVEDTGIGIDPAKRARLFVEFSQLDSGSARKYDGAGLGLAMTRLIVQAQGGTVGVESSLGVGSVFHFVLRRRMATPAGAA